MAVPGSGRSWLQPGSRLGLGCIVSGGQRPMQCKPRVIGRYEICEVRSLGGPDAGFDRLLFERSASWYAHNF
jgi:hypothetical protein